jgi:hypothetical protein
MRVTEIFTAWAVYRMRLHGNAVGGNVVCSQAEWDAIEKSQPGYHTLLHSWLKTEQEAEKLARGTAGDTKPRNIKTKKAIAVSTTPPVAND